VGESVSCVVDGSVGVEDDDGVAVVVCAHLDSDFMQDNLRRALLPRDRDILERAKRNGRE
jgi:hypothetical protein